MMLKDRLPSWLVIGKYYKFKTVNGETSFCLSCMNEHLKYIGIDIEMYNKHDMISYQLECLSCKQLKCLTSYERDEELGKTVIECKVINL